MWKTHAYWIENHPSRLGGLPDRHPFQKLPGIGKTEVRTHQVRREHRKTYEPLEVSPSHPPKNQGLKEDQIKNST